MLAHHEEHHGTLVLLQEFADADVMDEAAYLGDLLFVKKVLENLVVLYKVVLVLGIELHLLHLDLALPYEEKEAVRILENKNSPEKCSIMKLEEQ